ncbi:MAG: right-handed parallel beta-helix repeat-containing protein [Parvularculaceae bacterium]
MRRPFLFSAALAFAAASCGAPAKANDSEWLMRAISSARSGGVVDIPAGNYDLTDFKIGRSVTLRGAADGKTVFRSAAVTDKGILVPQTGVNLTVENITFIGTKSWDRNGAGIRHEGRNLTVVNCKFLDNDDGILSTGSADGVITITNSDFRDNGFGDGQSHAIYVSSGHKLDVEGGNFVNTRIGHHVKSLADITIVKGATLDDGYGKGSYAVDASKGGDVTVADNTIIQSADGENYTIINYDLTRGGAATRLVVTGNKIINRYDGGVFLRNDTKLHPVMAGNVIENEGKSPLKLLQPGTPKPVDHE